MITVVYKKPFRRNVAFCLGKKKMLYTKSNLPNFKLLSLILLAFSGHTDALFTGLNENSDPISESVFDLMATVLIASVITIDANRIRHKRRFLQATFYYIAVSITCVLLPALQIWFSVKAYHTTRDRFFLVYLVITFFQGLFIYIFMFTMACTKLHPKYKVIIPAP